MKKLIHTFAMAALLSAFTAATAAGTPEKLYVFGSFGTVGDTSIGWGAETASVDVVGGIATINIDGAKGGYSISSVGDVNDWGAINNNRVALASTAFADYGVEQNITTEADIAFPAYESDNYNVGNFTLTFDFNTGKATVVPSTLYFFGDAATTVNGKAVDWNGTESLMAADGYFTINTHWASSLTITPFAVGQSYYYGLGVEATQSGKIAPASILGLEQTVITDMHDIQPPYVGDFTIKISQDLKNIEYTAAPPRAVVLEVRDGYYDQAPLEYAMNTTDGYNYAYTFVEAVPEGRIYSIVIKKADGTILTQWRRNGTIADAQEEGWYTMGGETPSSMAESFKGTVFAAIPSAENLSWDNPYWSEAATAKVKFEDDGTTTAIDAIVVDAAMPAEYFNLQGARVENPQNGIFVERRGGKTRKVAL